jgi:asparagine synthase (glutamine-hydrolysing)
MYKVSGIENVICASYGRGSDHRISKAIADKLGYRWIYVDYSLEEQLKHYNSEKFKKLLEISHGYYSIPYFQEYLALQKIREVFSPEDIIISTGMEAGVRTVLRKELEYGIFFTSTFQDLVQRGVEEQKIVDNIVTERLRSRIRKEIAALYKKSPYADAYELNQALNLRERQTKFQNNSLRNIEYFGYSWIFPFYHRKLIEFWSKVPRNYKGKKNFFRNYCHIYLFKPLGLDMSTDGSKTRTFSQLGVYQNILYYHYKQKIYYRLARIYKNYVKRNIRIPNELDFDVSFQLLDEEIFLPQLNPIISLIRENNGITNWKRDPNFYLTNIVSKLVIQEIAKKSRASESGFNEMLLPLVKH